MTGGASRASRPVSLVIQIALINAFNWLNVATRQPAGAWAKSA